MNNRYFLIFWMGSHKPGGTTAGSIAIITNGEYFSLKKALSEINIHNPNVNKPVITNIIEMSEQDFKEFRS